ncbi:hypothetical protein [Desulfosediminicola sp.]|uniref:hypothetical protein n=1 Tax=Desulfosediminicola sp. TaxID=2886825 RepID=UPI003AF27E9F
MLKKSREINLVIIGGAGRNVGKTEFVCRLIQSFSAEYDIYALKVSAIFPDEHLYHGDHSRDFPEGKLFEENRLNGPKDTSRMLRAGAKKVFYLRSDDAGIEAGYREFSKRIPDNALVVCESNSLRSVVDPAIHIVVRSVSGEIKPRALAQLARADLVVVSDGTSGFSELDSIEIVDGNCWQLIP